MTRRWRSVASPLLAAVISVAPWGAPAPALTATTADTIANGAVTASTAASLPLSGLIIALDPGHNGGNATHLATIHRLVFIGNRWKACDTVGTTTRTGFPEHRFTFSVASRVKARLQALGAIVYMTRSTDTGVGPCINLRGAFGAKVHARLMVSIHGDGADSAFHGFFVMRPGLVRGYTDDIVVGSYRLAVSIRSGLKSVGLSVANYYATNGIKTRTDLGTLNMADVPTVMVELGNMKNSTDAARMMTWLGRDRYARGLVAGIRAFLGR